MKRRTGKRIKNFIIGFITVSSFMACIGAFTSLVEHGWNPVSATVIAVSMAWMAIFAWANNVFES